MHGYTRVTKEIFYATLYAAPYDIMPKITSSTYPYHKRWETQHTRNEFGQTVPDVDEDGKEIEKWFLLTESPLVKEVQRRMAR